MQYDVGSTEKCGVEERQDETSAESDCDVDFSELEAGSESDGEQRVREEHQAKMLADQREEILRHKWIESEKAQRDLGSEAVLDWIRRYAAQWRRWYEDQRRAKRA
jgi:hypothetical protein